MSYGRLSMDPHEVREVARGIERIADDLRGAQERFTGHAEPAATGRDEVSLAVGRTTAGLGAAQRRMGDAAVRDLAGLAHGLAAHAGTVQRRDAELAGVLRLQG